MTNFLLSHSVYYICSSPPYFMLHNMRSWLALWNNRFVLNVFSGWYNNYNQILNVRLRVQDQHKSIQWSCLVEQKLTDFSMNDSHLRLWRWNLMRRNSGEKLLLQSEIFMVSIVLFYVVSRIIKKVHILCKVMECAYYYCVYMWDEFSSRV